MPLIILLSLGDEFTMDVIHLIFIFLIPKLIESDMNKYSDNHMKKILEYLSRILASTIPTSSCKCGTVRGHSTRIVGGQPASKNQYPWQVALVSKGSSRLFCGGSLISSTSVLTAAHCRQAVASFDVVVGEHNTTDQETELQQAQIFFQNMTIMSILLKSV